ncbi:copper resistance protein NlpE [Sphingobacterium sp. lm-10]|uniref:copper resistance protein NlpE n=1 Tax=Sphingobacterium sp. lm-10 TaxID=2944904 RepID=UPI0020213C4B|nr:copper resistance protein NlpE [Sphingobacterium sp. lm-10]MCL7989287.1 copper resistance protein NlpE [Sphingobacterium sp. lm-10]
MRIYLYIISILTACLVSISCINNKANADVESNVDRSRQKYNLSGRYEGNLPCADCSAISTTLVLNKDRTYSLHYTYVGKSDELFHKDGVWRVDSDVLHLESEDYNYKIEGDRLSQLDLSGKEMTGNLAGKYILDRVD